MKLTLGKLHHEWQKPHSSLQLWMHENANVPKWTEVIKTMAILEHYNQTKPSHFPGKSENSRIKTISSLGKCPMPGWPSLSATSCAICTCEYPHCLQVNNELYQRWVGLDSHCTTKPEALEKCRWESGTYLIAASSVLLSSVIESVGSRKKKENQNQISRNQVSEFKSIHYHHDQSYCV